VVRKVVDVLAIGCVAGVGTYALDAVFWSDVIPVGSSMFWAWLNGTAASAALLLFERS